MGKRAFLLLRPRGVNEVRRKDAQGSAPSEFLKTVGQRGSIPNPVPSNRPGVTQLVGPKQGMSAVLAVGPSWRSEGGRRGAQSSAQ